MRPVQPSLTRPYGYRIEIGQCPQPGHDHCLVMVYMPSHTADGVFLGSLRSTLEHMTPAEACDVIDLLADEVAGRPGR